MPEGSRPYPRWDGPLAQAPPIGPIVGTELRRAWRNTWFVLALAVIAGYTLLYIGNTYTESQDADTHTIDQYVEFLSRPNVFAVIELTFAPLLLAAVMAGPSLLEDARRGALELYFSRAVGKWDYLAAKFIAVFGATTLSLFVPGLIFWGAAFFFYDQHPAGWALVPLQTLGYAVMWGLLVSALGLGFSAASRSSRAATLILFGGILGLHAVVSNILEGITRDGKWQILSPISALQQLTGAVFPVTGPFEFPLWWAAAEWAGLVGLGLLLLVWRRPRVRGEDVGRA